MLFLLGSCGTSPVSNVFGWVDSIAASKKRRAIRRPDERRKYIRGRADSPGGRALASELMAYIMTRPNSNVSP
jgi:hypothetical protein